MDGCITPYGATATHIAHNSTHDGCVMAMGLNVCTLDMIIATCGSSVTTSLHSATTISVYTQPSLSRLVPTPFEHPGAHSHLQVLLQRLKHVFGSDAVTLQSSFVVLLGVGVERAMSQLHATKPPARLSNAATDPTAFQEAQLFLD
jgi:hypothetical protein